MKRLTCEICGSTDLIKEDGAFVCQACGCKYSVEEAKKLILEVDGTVDIKGTVQIDKTDNIKQYLRMAWDAKKGKNYEECEKYANKVLEIDSNNSEASLLKGSAMAWQSSLSNIRIQESNVAWKNAITNADDASIPSIAKEIKSTYVDVVVALFSSYLRRLAVSTNPNDLSGPLSMTLNTLQMQYVLNMMQYEKEVKSRESIDENPFSDLEAPFISYSTWSMRVSEQENKTLESISRNNGLSSIMSTTLNLCTIACHFYTLIPVMLAEKDRLAAYDKQLETQQKVKTALLKIGGGDAARFTESIMSTTRKEKEEHRIQYQKKQKEEAKKRYDEYWNEHAEEKKALESEKEQLQNEKKELDVKLSEFKKKQEAVPAMEELNKIKTEINSLYDKQSKLGIFKGKEKKALQEQIDKLEDNKKGIEKTVKQQQYDLEPEIMPVKNRYKEVKERIDTIGWELKKER